MRLPIRFDITPALRKRLIRMLAGGASLQECAGLMMGGRLDIAVFNNREEMKLISQSHTTGVVTAEGINALLNVMFHEATQITTWYCVISETDTAGADGLTYAVPSFTEWEAYDEATRPAYTEAAASGKSMTNSANKAEFTANATKTLYGAGLVGGGTDPNTKGDAAGGGTLFDYGKFAASQPVVSANVVQLTITLTGADDGA